MKLGMVENERKKFRIMDYLIVIAASFSIVDLLSEDMSWELLGIDGIWYLIRDVLFIIATLVNIYIDKKSKWIYMHVFSVILIIAFLVMKLLVITYPTWLLIFWCFYVWGACGAKILFGENNESSKN